MAKKLLIIGLVWPEPNATAAGSRMMQLIHFFLSQKYSITYASTAKETGSSLDLTTLGVEKAGIVLNHSSFDVFAEKLNPSLVLFDRFMTEEQFGWRIAAKVPNAIRILDTEDLHSLRMTRLEAHKRNIPFSLGMWLQQDITKREMASIYRCDLSLIISSFEMEFLLQKIKIAPSILYYLPFQLDRLDENTTNKWLPFNKRKDFICIGTGKHAPNIDSFLWLKKEIWPLVHQQLPQAKLYLYGSYFPQKVTQLHNPNKGFHVMGKVENANEVMQQVRVNLAPLRFGAGIKGKLITAMCSGTPSVTTPIGAEGMHADCPWGGTIANDKQTFAKAAVALYQDRAKWQKAQENGTAIINTIYDKTVLNKALALKIEQLEHQLDTHRQQNFIGSMLRHHTMASTTYMAKWISAKNKID